MNLESDPIHIEEDPFKVAQKRALRWFLALVSGASLVYVISAALLLAGVQRLLPDFQVHDGDFWQKLSPVGAIHLYEIALIVVLGLVAIWKKVFDDAISISMLSAMFMVAGAATLNMIPHEAYALALAMGVVGIVLAGLKIALLWPCVVDRLHYSVMAGLGLILSTSFLMPGILAGRIEAGMVNSQMLPYWTVGWWVWLLGAALLVVGSAGNGQGAWTEADRGKPFLQTSLMRWIMVAIVLVASAVHQQGVIWVIALPLSWADLIMAGSLAWLLWLDVRRVYGKNWGAIDYLPGIGILGTVFYVVADQSYHSTWDSWGLVSYPPMVAILTGLGLGALAYRSGKKEASIVATLFVSVGMLLWGNSPEHRMQFEHENLMTFYGVIALATGIGAIVNRSFTLAAAAWCFIALEAKELVLCLPSYWTIQAYSSEAWFLTAGIGMMLLAIVAGRKTPAPLVCVASFLAFGGMHWIVRFAPIPAWNGPAYLAIGVACVGLAMAWRTRRYFLPIPTLVPISWILIDGLSKGASSINPGWLLVAAAFATLGVGATISFWRAGRTVAY